MNEHVETLRALLSRLRTQSRIVATGVGLEPLEVAEIGPHIHEQARREEAALTAAIEKMEPVDAAALDQEIDRIADDLSAASGRDPEYARAAVVSAIEAEIGSDSPGPQSTFAELGSDIPTPDMHRDATVNAVARRLAAALGERTTVSALVWLERVVRELQRPAGSLRDLVLLSLWHHVSRERDDLRQYFKDHLRAAPAVVALDWQREPPRDTAELRAEVERLAEEAFDDHLFALSEYAPTLHEAEVSYGQRASGEWHGYNVSAEAPDERAALLMLRGALKARLGR